MRSTWRRGSSSSASPDEILVGLTARSVLVRDGVVDRGRRALSTQRARPNRSRAWRSRCSIVPGAAGSSAPARFATRRPRSGSRHGSRRLSTNQAPERTCKVVTVVGAAGVGKSRLTREFLRECRQRRDGRTRSLPPLRGGNHLLASCRGACGMRRGVGERDTADDVAERIRPSWSQRATDADRRARTASRAVLGLGTAPRYPGDLLGSRAGSSSSSAAAADSWSCSTTSTGREPTLSSTCSSTSADFVRRRRS